MPSFRSPEKQALKIIKKRAMHGQKKEKGKRGENDGIHSIGTEKRYAQALTSFARWRQENGMNDGLNRATLEQAMQYLEQRAQTVGQKTLDADRHALQKLLRIKIETVQAKNKNNQLATKSRAYTAKQVEAITRHQTPANALATKIAYACGLRAHELHTITRTENGKYTVTGKGGLKREIKMPKKLAQELEQRRLTTPQKIKDRGIIYMKNYDIGGGNAFSRSFTAASQRALGFSNGAHGLRHSYAQEQLVRYQAAGMNWNEAREAVSRELGHFRPQITHRYLR
jgi:integrase